MQASTDLVQNLVDWPAFLGRHDLIWERSPLTWIEGAFIGNGRLGAMIYKGDGEAEPGAEVLSWTIGRSDVYDHRTPSTGAWTDRCRVPIGRFHLKPVGVVQRVELRIDLWNACATGSVRTDRGTILWRSWVQASSEADGGLVIVDLETDAGEREAGWEWQAFKSMCPRFHARPVEDYRPNPPGHAVQLGSTRAWVQPLLNGGEYSTAWRSERRGDHGQVLYCAVGYEARAGGSTERAARTVDSAAAAELEAMQSDHRRWWHDYYRRSFLSIPDARLEGYYWIQMYKLASATRADTVIVDTCGPWLKVDTVWPATWWNLNVQLFHYPISVANHNELNEPLVRLLKQELDNGHLIANAPAEMRHDSAYFGNPTTVHDLLNHEVYWSGEKVKNLSGRTRPAAKLNHLPWICHTLWEQYRRTMDDKMLRDILFPLTRRAYSFIFHFIEEGSDGRLHIKDTYSSEYGAADDANEAIAMIVWGCNALLWMCDRLGIDDPDLSRWKDILNRLVDPPVDEYGLMIGSDVSFTRSHRHYSHLMSLVPFRTWDCADPAKRELAMRSLSHFLRQRAGLAGYSYTGASSMYALLGDGDEALYCLRLYLHHFDRASTMYTETNPASPVMETPPSAARCVQDMLLQSHDGIRVFPAVPSKWRDACFANLLAEGAFEVSARRENGRTRWVRIRSLAGEPCRVWTDLAEPVAISGGETFAVALLADGMITLDLAKGQEVLLAEKPQAARYSIKPVTVDPNQCNYYGLKRRA